MEFKLEVATAAGAQWQNTANPRDRVVILNRKKKPILASLSLMPYQINAVVEAHANGQKRVVVRD